MREDWTYSIYLREAAIGMLTAWSRLQWYADEAIEGMKALAFMLALLILPALFWLAPIVALLARASDRRDAAQAKKFAEDFKRGIHKWGGR